jgi:transmembrane sensor
LGTRPASMPVAYHTLAAPHGSRYQVELPDGSRVWLNAASALRFPTAFAGAQRRVWLTGQAYFEVAHNKRQPFRVEAGGTSVQVLGTHFDVMAYPDEPGVRTTLLEGSVNVSRAGQQARLRAGQQALCLPGSAAPAQPLVQRGHRIRQKLTRKPLQRPGFASEHASQSPGNADPYGGTAL